MEIFNSNSQIATDPKLAYQKAKELWATLSLPEPENQARPATLEQLLVLLTREFARRIVHLVNATTILASRSPRVFGRLLVTISHQMLFVADAAIKVSIIIIFYQTLLSIHIILYLRIMKYFPISKNILLNFSGKLIYR